MKPNRIDRRERGNAMVAMLVAVVLCGAVSASVVVTNTGRQHEADASLNRERAFQLAEAGVDWAVSQVRIGGGVIPVFAAPDIHTVAGSGTFTLRYAQGNTNGRDDNGNGTIDEASESDYAIVTSTGESGGMRRTIEVVVRKAVQTPSFEAGVQLNVDTPIFDVNGNAFRISGADHDLDGTVDPTGPVKYGIASPAPIADLASQIPANRADNITGLGGTPSVGKVAVLDLTSLMQQAQSAASMIIAPGIHTYATLGTPASGGTVVAYCKGDLKLSGGGSGAGILAVDGDLEISGGFSWTGIILVRGSVTLVGGGSGKRLIGAMGVGQEITSTVSTTSVDISGTVDILYSQDAIALAGESLGIMAVMSWREVGNP